MPELPEVETVKRGIEQIITGATIKAVNQRRADLRIPFPPELKKRLCGLRVETITRRAKYILLHLSNQTILVLHLGMSGRVLLSQDKDKNKEKNKHNPLSKHDHLVLTFNNGATLIFNDPRRFGMVLLIATAEQNTHPAFKNMGPEPLGNRFSAAFLQDRLKNKKTSIKAALLDQKIVAGLGNIYVCEALFYSGIAPQRPAQSLTKSELDTLVQQIRIVLTKAIDAGGSSLKDYRTASGDLGYFQFSFAVYDREGKPCPRCHCDVSTTGGVKRITQSGRSSFYCPRKQT